MKGARVVGAVLLAIGAGCSTLLGIQDRPLRPDGGAVEDSSTVQEAEAPDAADGSRDAGSVYFEAVMADEPLVYLRFGEDGGATAINEVDAQASGTYPGGATLGQTGALLGDPNTAVRLDGTGGVSMPPGVDFEGVQAYSVEIWVKPDSPFSGLAFVVDHEQFDPQRGGWTLLLQYGVPSFERFSDAALDLGLGEDAGLTPKKWHHLVGTMDGTDAGGAVTLYVDGQPVAMRVGGTRLPLPTLDGGWTIGAQNYPSFPDNGFSGVIDELAVYDQALSANRVAAHFTAATHP